jgi:hypothetical protein
MVKKRLLWPIRLHGVEWSLDRLKMRFQAKDEEIVEISLVARGSGC